MMMTLLSDRRKMMGVHRIYKLVKLIKSIKIDKNKITDFFKSLNYSLKLLF